MFDHFVKLAPKGLRSSLVNINLSAVSSEYILTYERNTLWKMTFSCIALAYLPTENFLFYQQNRENARAACAGLFIGRCISSRLQIFFKIVVLKNFAIITEKHVSWNLFLMKLHAFRLSNLNLKLDVITEV